jgi:hypothetical protein
MKRTFFQKRTAQFFHVHSSKNANERRMNGGKSSDASPILLPSSPSLQHQGNKSTSASHRRCSLGPGRQWLHPTPPPLPSPIPHTSPRLHSTLMPVIYPGKPHTPRCRPLTWLAFLSGTLWSP